MNELTSKEVGFLRSFLGSDESKKVFTSIFEKMIDELKDVESFDSQINLEEQLKVSLKSVKKLREILQRILLYASTLESTGKFQNI